jgi:hypothetical protein
MDQTVNCRKISKGFGEGEALVCHESIGFNFGVDVPKGVIIEHNHELEGQSFKGKVLVFPHGKGSTGGFLRGLSGSPWREPPRRDHQPEHRDDHRPSAPTWGGIPVVDHLEDGAYNQIETVTTSGLCHRR